MSDKVIIPNTLTPNEIADYKRCKYRIATGIEDVARALEDVRDRLLYRDEYKTFEEFCQEEFGKSRRHVNRLISAFKVNEALGLIVKDITSGTILSQNPIKQQAALELSVVVPEQQAEAYQAAKRQFDTDTPTAWEVRQVVQDGVDKGEYKPQRVTEDARPTSEPETFGRHKPKTNRAGNEYAPQGNDACQTPAYALDPLLPYLDTSWVVWEPACGEGLLIDALYDSSFSTVHASDLLDGQNFFEYQPDASWDVLITNPPYTLKYKWLERCYLLGKPFALLVPVETIGAASAQVLMKQYGFEILLLDRRVNFKMPNMGFEGKGAQFPVLWLCWKLLPEPVMFGHIEYPQSEQAAVSDD